MRRAIGISVTSSCRAIQRIFGSRGHVGLRGAKEALAATRLTLRGEGIVILTEAYLNVVSTSVPRHDVHTAFVRFAGTMLADREKKLFNRMAERADIAHRYSVLAPADDPGADAVDAEGFYTRGSFPSSNARMAAYEAAALPLALEAVDGLHLGLDTALVSHLIVTSCTGFYAPGLDMQLAAILGLRPGVERSVVGFMGCYAAFNALKLARHIVRSEPKARVLLVNLELCTLHLQETSDIERILSFLVFADGCAAALVSASPTGIALDRFYAALIPDSEDLITWRIGDDGFTMILSGRVPNAIAGGLSAAAPLILDGCMAADVELWAVHPGGRSVLDAVQGALELPSEALSLSRGVLKDFGNMSSATILFVLGRLLASSSRGSRGCAMGFGPGLMAETMLFHTV